MNPENIKLIEDIFRAVFELDDSTPASTISRDSHKNWDSMAQVALMSALDDEFDLVINVQDAVAIMSFQTCVDIIENYLEQ